MTEVVRLATGQLVKENILAIHSREYTEGSLAGIFNPDFTTSIETVDELDIAIDRALDEWSPELDNSQLETLVHTHFLVEWDATITEWILMMITKD